MQKKKKIRARNKLNHDRHGDCATTVVSSDLHKYKKQKVFRSFTGRAQLQCYEALLGGDIFCRSLVVVAITTI
jgi:hypothetical protein